MRDGLQALACSCLTFQVHKHKAKSFSCIPAAENGLGPAAANLADTRVPWIGTPGTGA